MVAAISDPKPTTTTNTTRPPLLHNASSAASSAASQRRVVLRGRQVSSKYMSTTPSPSPSSSTSTTTSSSSSSRRCPSPLLSRSMNSSPAPNSVPKRAQSADRRRPGTPHTRPDPRLSNAGSEASAATRLLVTSTRSLSVSFQGEAFSLPISKAKAAAAAAPARKPTPERRRSTPVRRDADQVENSRPGDQHRWPARTRQPGHPNPNLSRSVELSSVSNGVGSGVVARALLQVDESSRGSRSRSSFDRRLSLDLGHLGGNADVLRASQHNPDASNESSVPSDPTASDTDSVSSGSTSGVQDSNGAAKSRGGGGGGAAVPRGIAVSARFWQETNSRLRRLQDPGSPLATSPVSRTGSAGKYIQSKKFNVDNNNNAVSSPRTLASPVRGASRPASPGKLWTSSSMSPSRGSASPSRVRNSFGGPGQLSSGYGPASTPSFLSFSIDTRRGKKGEDRIVDAYMLRLLYNRHQQWRFVNARADATYMVQRVNAEENLWNAWVTISELRHNVTLKRIKLLLLRHKLKLTSILKGQIKYLEDWALLDRDHSSSLLGANEALQASILRLPVVGAIVDFQELKDSVGSAADVMEAMAASICSLSSKVEEMNCLVSELVKVTTTERLVLEQCKDFLSTISAMQVKDCSLRTHIIQLKRLPLPAA
ncbi:QWRF motif-containing protein 2 [Argentina anserina]|uniref:QWRF motif-containing protein 2 n=1 Tax=Argentina anserina TaxID=57926 RepID=UPI0021761D8C|nr:QWRF motif-containing protein 2 [Potentilla anserina]